LGSFRDEAEEAAGAAERRAVDVVGCGVSQVEAGSGRAVWDQDRLSVVHEHCGVSRRRRMGACGQALREQYRTALG